MIHRQDIEFTRELYAARGRIRDLESLVVELRRQADDRESAARGRLAWSRSFRDALAGQQEASAEVRPGTPEAAAAKHMRREAEAHA